MLREFPCQIIIGTAEDQVIDALAMQIQGLPEAQGVIHNLRIRGKSLLFTCMAACRQDLDPLSEAIRNSQC